MKKIIKRKIKTNKGIYFITTEQEKNFTFTSEEIILNLKKKIEKKIISIRKNKNFKKGKSNDVKFINILPNQITSIGTGLIPFLEHNDANRALMGSNMQRQAVALIKEDNPFVQTGLEQVISKNSEFTILAKKSGQIKYVSKKKIIIKEEKKSLNSRKNFQNYKSLKDKIKDKIKNKRKYQKRYYYIEKGRKSNQNNYIKKIPINNKNEWVKKGQIIATTNNETKSTLTLGKNILIAYIGWEGYNFEDAIVISERIVKNNIFTSIHLKKYKTFITNYAIGEVRL